MSESSGYTSDTDSDDEMEGVEWQTEDRADDQDQDPGSDNDELPPGTTWQQ